MSLAVTIKRGGLGPESKPYGFDPLNLIQIMLAQENTRKTVFLMSESILCAGMIPALFYIIGKKGRQMRKKLSKTAPILVIIALLIFWELVVRIAGIPLYVLPAPSDMFAAFVEDLPALLGHSAVTVMEALTGMGISIVVGIFIGILIDAMPTFKKCIYPILVVTQTVPVIVLAPIFIIYMGFGYAPKILTVVLMCFFPIVVSFSDGLGEMDQGYLNLVNTYGGSRLQIYRIVKIPMAMISLLSGLKVAATYSISGAVVGEWIASQSGLGYYILRAKNSYMLDKVFACVLMIILLSLLMNGLVKLFGYAVLPMKRRRRRKA